MTARFKVERVSDLANPLFIVDPSDPKNTVHAGKWVQEITFVRISDPMRGGVGTLVLTLEELDQVGSFTPGQVVNVEVTPV